MRESELPWILVFFFEEKGEDPRNPTSEREEDYEKDEEFGVGNLARSGMRR